MKNNTPLYLGAAAVAAYLVYSNYEANTAVPITTTPAATAAVPATASSNGVVLPTAAAAVNTTSAIPAPPAVYDQTYYLTYQYPAILAYDSNIGNPKYVMTDAEAQQYINNYYDLQDPPGVLNTWGTGMNTQGKIVSSHDYNILDSARQHWSIYGVPEKRSFIAFYPANNMPPVITPTAPKAAKSSTLSDVLGVAEKVAPIAVALAGIPGQMTNGDIALIASGNAVLSNILPMYYNSPGGSQAFAIEDKINSILNQYL